MCLDETSETVLGNNGRMGLEQAHKRTLPAGRGCRQGCGRRCGMCGRKTCDDFRSSVCSVRRDTASTADRGRLVMPGCSAWCCT